MRPTRFWLEQRNLYANMAYEYADNNQPVPRYIKEQLRLIEAVIKQYKKGVDIHI